MRRDTSRPGAKRKTARRALLVLSALLLFLTVNLTAGVLVAPTVVIMSDQNRTGRINLQNPTDKPTEVTINFGFGLPESDSLGNVSVMVEDSNIVDPRSAIDWIKAFPRKVLIPPQGSQVVRLVARPPKDLSAGEYWARIVIRSQEGQTEIPVAGQEDRITTRLNMILQTAIMLKYRTGECRAEIELAGVEKELQNDRAILVVDLKNHGNVSYVGRLECKLYDADQKQVGVYGTDLAVYRDLKRRIEMAIEPGSFSLPLEAEIVITNKGRNDIAKEDMIFGNDITQRVALR